MNTIKLRLTIEIDPADLAELVKAVKDSEKAQPQPAKGVGNEVLDRSREFVKRKIKHSEAD